MGRSITLRRQWCRSKLWGSSGGRFPDCLVGDRAFVPGCFCSPSSR
jgi:hypothetical protein